MSTNPPTVLSMAAVPVPDPMPAGVSRPREHVAAVLAQSLAELGGGGRGALAWDWALTGSRPSPVTLSLPPGRPPSRQELLAEAEADPQGSTAPPGVPTDYCDQLGEARRILRWLTGTSDEIPADCEDRGHLIGARDDYARTDHEIRAMRDAAQRGLESAGPVAPGGDPWRREPTATNAAWLRGVRDLLDWVLGDRPDAPLSGQAIRLPSACDLSYEDSAAEDILHQARPSGHPADPARYPPPQYGEAIQATIRWLRGESTAPPVTPFPTLVRDP